MINLYVSAGMSPYTYLWSNGETTEDLEDLEPGLYSVTVTDNNGVCDFIDVEVLAYETASYYEAPSCPDSNDGMAYFNSSGCDCNTSFCQYTWELNGEIIAQGDGTNASETYKYLFDIGPGIYTATIIHPDGCAVQEEIIIPDTNGIINDYVIIGDCYANGLGSIELFSDNSLIVTYSWNTGETTSMINNLTAGTYSVTASTTDCEETMDFVIENFAPYDCEGNCLNDIDNDSICDELDECIGDYDECGECNGDNSCNTIYSQLIELEEGWNIWSTYINPQNSALNNLFNDIIENVVIVKDQYGAIYWPEYGINSIGELDIGFGYQTRMTETSDLIISGSLVPSDYEINLAEGWNILGYLLQSFNNVYEVFAPYSENIIIMKDENGSVYWPEYELNNIGTMSPGEGYQLKTNMNLSFYYEDELEGKSQFVVQKYNNHFSSPTITDNNMIILFPFWGNNYLLDYYDEVAAYNQNGILVGSSISFNDHTVLTIWGDDITTLHIDGMVEGESFVFKLWDFDKNLEKTIELDYSEGYGFYTQNGINVVQSIMQHPDLFHNPNLIGTIDLLGRQIHQHTSNMFLIDVYENGSVEKRYVHKQDTK